MSRVALGALGLACITLGACSLGVERPRLPVFDAEARFSTSRPQVPTQTDSFGGRPWWQGTLPRETSESLRLALADNPRLRQAQAQIAIAKGQVDQAIAGTGATLVAGANASVQNTEGDQRVSQGLDLDARLPVDLSGSQGDRIDAAKANLRAVEADAAQLSADLARDFVLALLDSAEARGRQRLIEQQIALTEELLRFVELRFSQGMASSVDVLQQRDQLGALRQQLPPARLEERLALNRMRQIAAKPPGRPHTAIIDELPVVTPALQIPSPIALLARRADLRALQARLSAADARFAAALAERWPEVNLSAGMLSRSLDGDFTRLLSASLGAVVHLFDSGERRAIATQRRAELLVVAESWLAAWLAVVLDIEDLLHEEATLIERSALLETRLHGAQALMQASQRRYEQGVSDYLPVLEALRSLQQLQRERLRLEVDLASNRIRLRHALGEDPVVQNP